VVGVAVIVTLTALVLMLEEEYAAVNALNVETIVTALERNVT